MSCYYQSECYVADLSILVWSLFNLISTKIKSTDVLADCLIDDSVCYVTSTHFIKAITILNTQWTGIIKKECKSMSPAIVNEPSLFSIQNDIL